MGSRGSEARASGHQAQDSPRSPGFQDWTSVTAQAFNSLPRGRKGPLLSTPMLQHGHVCTDMHTWTHTCAHASTHSVHIKCVHTRTHRRTHVHTPHIDTQAHTGKHTHIHTRTHRRAPHIDTHIHTDKHTGTHTSTNTHACTHTGKDAHIHTHSCTHTGKDTHIHTSTHNFSIPTEENYQSSTPFIF